MDAVPDGRAVDSSSSVSGQSSPVRWVTSPNQVSANCWPSTRMSYTELQPAPLTT
jgi:hypothetical protein